MIHIDIIPQYKKIINIESVTSAALKVMENEKIDSVDISFIFQTDAFITELNRKYRGIDSSTDVLSFEMGYFDPETGRKYLGDVVIAVPTAQRQAGERNVSLKTEIDLLIVHGFLHLLGYDHANMDDQQKMWKAQEKILAAINQAN